METDELKNIWKTLASEKLIETELAEENIERLITLKSSNTLQKLTKKMKLDFISNIIASSIIIAATLFASIFLHLRNQSLPIQGYIFLILAFSFYAIKTMDTYSKIKLLKLSFSTSTILDSLRKVKKRFEKISKKEYTITYIAVFVLTIYSNVLINENTDFSNYRLHSLQGYVLVFSVCYIISLPWLGKFIFKKRFSGIIDALNSSIDELDENKLA